MSASASEADPPVRGPSLHIVEIILDGRARSDVVLEKLEATLSTEWKAQRSLLARFSGG
jgi:hypothetical protein